jgi:hypothetical protein
VVSTDAASPDAAVINDSTRRAVRGGSDASVTPLRAASTISIPPRLWVQFEKRPRSAENEATLKPILDKVLGTGGYELECRAEVCRISGDGDPELWTQALQHHPEVVGRFSRIAFRAGVGMDVYVALQSSSQTAAARIAAAIWTAFIDSEDIDGCKEQHPEPGAVDLWLVMRTRRQIAVELSGSLAASPISSCLRRALETRVSEQVVPTDMTEVPAWKLTIAVP